MPVFTSLADRCDSCGGKDVEKLRKKVMCVHMFGLPAFLPNQNVDRRGLFLFSQSS